MSRRRSDGARACVLLVAAAVGCAQPDDRARGPFPDEPYANAAAAESALAEGQHYFLHETWGAEQHGSWPPASFLVELQEEEPEVFGDQFAAFGFLRDARDDLPVGLERGSVDDERVMETCALCHVAALPDGRLWLGAPNTALEYGRFKVEVNRRWVEAGNAPLFDDVAEEKLLALGPGRVDASSGDYPRAVPADFPPYFRLGDKTALNHLGTGGDLRSEAAMSIYSAGAGHTTEDGVEVPFPSDDKLAAFVAFLGQLEPPENPTLPDEGMIERGAEVFRAARCDACHHVVDVAANAVVPHVESGPERVPDEEHPRGAIATSVAHRVLIDGDDEGGGGPDLGYVDLVLFLLGRGLDIKPSDGYRAPDLGGLWATPPYLHNGSVPTLEDLLRPASERPVTFARGSFVVDTGEWGNGNEGHELGTDLDDDDKAALLAFLRSL